MTLNDFMVSELFAFLLVFCRMGSACMLLPGIGEAYISSRFRLLFAVMLSLIVAPTLTNIPELPSTVWGTAIIIINEILTGLFLGTITRLLISAVSIAGMIIAYQASLASALVQDVTISGGQASSLGNLMGLCALVLIFSTGMHHLMLQAVHQSYQIFSIGTIPIIGDFTTHTVNVVNASFLIALQLAAPHIVIGLIMYLAAGIIGRLMPNFQVFFVLTAPQLVVSFFVLMTAFQTIMTWYMDYFEQQIRHLMGL